MPIVADASVAIRGDLSGFHKDLKGAERQTQTLGQKLNAALTPKNILVGGAGLLGIGIGVRQLIGWAGDAADAYSDLQQAATTVDTAFGTSAGVIEDWADRAADAAGLSKQEVFTSAAVMGTSLRNMGIDAETAAGYVIDLQQRAADLAIALGTDTPTVLDAMNSALRGEYDTIQRLGVNFDAADVKARALTLGLDTTTDAAKRQSDATAVLSLIMDETSTSAGRFADSQDDIAVKLEQNQAKVDNFNSTVGRFIADQQVAMVDDAESFIGSVDDMVGEWDKFTLNFGDNAQKLRALSDGTADGFDAMKQRILAEMGATGDGFEEVVARIERELAGLPPVMDAETQRALAAWKQNDLGGAMVGDIEGATDGIVGDVTVLPEEMADALLANQFALTGPEGAIAALVEFMDQALTPAQERFNAQAFLASDEYKEGLNSGIPAVEKKAQEMGAAAEAVLANVDYYTIAANSGFSFGAGLVDPAVITFVEKNAARLAAAARGIFPGSEPENPNSPLRGITKAFGFGDILARGILADGGAVSDAMAGILRTPAIDPAMVGPVGSGSGLPGAVLEGGGVHYHLYVEGKPITVDGPRDIIEKLHELGGHWG